MKFVLACGVLALFAPRPSQVTDRDKVEARQHYQRGQDALRNEKLDEAEREFQTSIKLDPTFELSRYGLGQTYMAMKRYPDAVTAFQKCRDVIHGNNTADASDQVARDRRIDDSIKELEDQKRVYQQPGRNSNNPTTSLYLKQIDIQLGQMREARHRHATGEESTPAWLSLALGSAYFRSDAVADAEREYKNAITVDPKLGEAHNNLAVVYLMTNRPSEASAELAAAEKSGFKVNPQLKEDIRSAVAKKE